ncbi:uncharacterized protein LOC141665271 [Apium graveolens]|uniref:uncharacterized protein LOC141665271 n=1 Tax=Apium graveolens TaxID=4045 RepID=UPI003D7A5B66
MAADSGNFTTPCVPKFDGDYDNWSLIMENLLRSKEYWSVIESGIEKAKENEATSKDSQNEATKKAQQKAFDEARLKDLKAKNYLFQSIDKSILKTITHKETAKQLWESMKVRYQGSARVKRAQLQRLRSTFEILEMKSGEGVSYYFARVMSTANDMRNCGEDMNDVKIVEKILRSLTDNFNFVVCSIEESKDIDKLTVDELQASLLVHEQKVISKRNEEQVFQVESEPRNMMTRGRNTYQRGRNGFRGRGRGNKTWFIELDENYKHSVKLGNSSRLMVEGKWSVSSIEKEAKTSICVLRTDRGGEFTTNEFNKFCKDHAIRRQLTAAYSPQQNGVAKRRNRTIMNMVHCLLSEKEMSRSLWPEAANWTAHVLNRSFTKAVKDMVPEERWTEEKPNVDYFRVFGSIAHMHIPEQKRIKLDDRSHKCVLLGVGDESKAYRLYDPVTKEIAVSRDVIFEENKQ